MYSRRYSAVCVLHFGTQNINCEVRPRPVPPITIFYCRPSTGSLPTSTVQESYYSLYYVHFRITRLPASWLRTCRSTSFLSPRLCSPGNPSELVSLSPSACLVFAAGQHVLPILPTPPVFRLCGVLFALFLLAVSSPVRLCAVRIYLRFDSCSCPHWCNEGGGEGSLASTCFLHHQHNFFFCLDSTILLLQ